MCSPRLQVLAVVVGKGSLRVSLHGGQLGGFGQRQVLTEEPASGDGRRPQSSHHLLWCFESLTLELLQQLKQLVSIESHVVNFSTTSKQPSKHNTYTNLHNSKHVAHSVETHFSLRKNAFKSIVTK